jgi:hypothetical protein
VQPTSRDRTMSSGHLDPGGFRPRGPPFAVARGAHDPRSGGRARGWPVMRPQRVQSSRFESHNRLDPWGFAPRGPLSGFTGASSAVVDTFKCLLHTCQGTVEPAFSRERLRENRRDSDVIRNRSFAADLASAGKPSSKP